MALRQSGGAEDVGRHLQRLVRSGHPGVHGLVGDPSIGEVVMTLVRPDGSPDLRAATRFFLRHPGRLPRMVRLGRDSSVAATTAARASVSALV